MKKLTTITTLLALASLAAPSLMAFDGNDRVPDAGSTMLLLSLSVGSIGLVRRMFGHKK